MAPWDHRDSYSLSQGALGSVSSTHLQNPASVWNQAPHGHKSGFVSPAASAWVWTRNKIDPPCDHWPWHLGGHLACSPAQGFSCCFWLSLFLDTHRVVHLFTVFSQTEYALSPKYNKGIFRQHCLPTGRMKIWIVFIGKAKWKQPRKASHNYQMKRMENSFFEFCCSDTSSSHWYDKLTKHTIEHSLISARASNTEYIHMYIHTRVCVHTVHDWWRRGMS